MCDDVMSLFLLYFTLWTAQASKTQYSRQPDSYLIQFCIYSYGLNCNVKYKIFALAGRVMQFTLQSFILFASKQVKTVLLTILTAVTIELEQCPGHTMACTMSR